MLGLDIAVEKLIKLTNYINQLQKIKPNSYEEYISDLTRKYAVERLMQLIVDVALDINNVLLAYMNRPPASDYFNSFVDLSECSVLQQSFAFDIAPSTGLRNRLVHEYEKVNDKVVYESIEKVIKMYQKYMIEVNKFIK